MDKNKKKQHYYLLVTPKGNISFKKLFEVRHFVKRFSEIDTAFKIENCRLLSVTISEVELSKI